MSLPVAFYHSETQAAFVFFVTGIVFLLAGQLIMRSVRREVSPPKTHILIEAVAGWVSACLIAALPFFLIAFFTDDQNLTQSLQSFRSPLNALFESVSGLTTTGLTMTLREEELPHSLLWWRSLLQWTGGLGVIVLFLLFITPVGGTVALFETEGGPENKSSSMRKTTLRITKVYLSLTILALITFLILGMPVWQAFNIAMTSVSTGGFALHSDSLASMPSVLKHAVIISMVTGAVTFMFYVRLFSGQFVALSKYRGIFVLVFLLVFAPLFLLWANPSWSFMDGVFQSISAITTTGFSTIDIGAMSTVNFMYLCILMFIGGMAGSTAGGFKVNRLIDLGVYLVRHVLHLIPRKPGRPRKGWDIFNHPVLACFVLWIIMLIAGSAGLMLFESAKWEQAVFEVNSALSIVGLSSGITGPEMSISGKMILIFLMLFGRLEAIPFLLMKMWQKPA